MSDIDPTTTPPPDPTQAPPDSEALRHAREAAERAAAAAARVPTLEVENALLRVGVTDEALSGELGQMFRNSIATDESLRGEDGNIDRDKVRAKAIAVGLVSDGEPPPTDEPPTDPATNTETADRLTIGAGGTPPPTPQVPDPDPATAGLENFERAIQAGRSRENAAAEFFDRVIDAGAKGDERVIYDPDRDRGTPVAR